LANRRLLGNRLRFAQGREGFIQRIQLLAQLAEVQSLLLLFGDDALIVVDKVLGNYSLCFSVRSEGGVCRIFTPWL
jgi:hypothetical protein